MKKLSSRAVTALSNLALVFIVVCVGIACLFPTAKQAAATPENVYYKGYSERGVSLMFNVYWGTDEVKEILNILEERNATATFFLGGSWADDNADTVRLIAEKGHEIGSHGYFHRDHEKLNYAQNVEEIKTSVEFIKLVTGGEVTLFAPPSGAYNQTTVNAATSLGLKTVLWSKDTIDWRDKDEAVCYRRATENVSGGELVLMHPVAHTVTALPDILKYYEDNGFHTVTVGENLTQKSEGI